MHCGVSGRDQFVRVGLRVGMLHGFVKRFAICCLLCSSITCPLSFAFWAINFVVLLISIALLHFICFFVLASWIFIVFLLAWALGLSLPFSWWAPGLPLAFSSWVPKLGLVTLLDCKNALTSCTFFSDVANVFVVFLPMCLHTVLGCRDWCFLSWSDSLVGFQGLWFDDVQC